MTLFQTLKHNARRSLRGSWGKAITAPLILILCWILMAAMRQYAVNLFVPAPEAVRELTIAGLMAYRVSATETVILFLFVFVSVLLEAPLLLGIIKWYYRLALGEAVPFSEVFCYFDRAGIYCKAIWLFITVSVRAFLWAFLFFILPGSMLGLSIGILNKRWGLFPGDARAASTVGGMAVFVSVLLLAAAVVIYAAFMNRYALSFYIFFDDPDARITALLRKSIAYSKGYRLNMLGFFLSFIGWFILCVFVIPFFFAVPYCCASMSMYARYVIERREREAAETTGHTKEFSVEEPQPAANAPEAESFVTFPQNRYMEPVSPPEGFIPKDDLTDEEAPKEDMP